ncbi:MAG: hypothetical protein AAFQ60_15370 [Pseudomonadota bacterium]
MTKHAQSSRVLCTSLTILALTAVLPAQAQQSDRDIPGISVAADLFTQFCIDNREDITALIDLLPAEGFAWSPDTKRFVHPTHDLSFALLQSEIGFACTMQFANHVDAATSAAIFVRKTASRQVTVNVGFPDDTSDRNYVQASVAAEANLTQ